MITHNYHGARAKKLTVHFGDISVSHGRGVVNVNCRFPMATGGSRVSLIRSALQRTAAEIHLLLKDTKA